MAPLLAQSQIQSTSVSEWFDSKTGIYNSKHKPLQLPETPCLDIVSYIFSHLHNGVSALIDSASGVSISYLQLPQMVDSVASDLYNIGVCQNDVVLIFLPNTIFFPVVFLGVLSVGAVATTMNPFSTSTEIKKQILDCKVSLVFTDSDNASKIKNLNLGVRVETVPYISNFVSFARRRRPVINQQDTAVILYSSGTSGVSKGVALSHANLIAAVELFVRFEAVQYSESFPILRNVYLAAIPMFHVYGLSLFAMGLLSLGSKIVVMRKFSADEMVKAIECHGVTHVPAVPPILMALLRAKDLCGCNLRSLKQVSCGAAPLSKKIILNFLQRFPHVDFIQNHPLLYKLESVNVPMDSDFSNSELITNKFQSKFSPDWFCSKIGIYRSTHTPIELPETPFLDVASYIFSHKHFGDSAFVDFSSGFSLSYTRLRKMVNSFASGLRESGISQGDVVLILLPNTIFFPVVFMGIIALGAIATPMNPLSTVTEIKKQIVSCKVTLVFTESENAEKVDKLNMAIRIIRVPLVKNFLKLESSEFSCFIDLVSSHPDIIPSPKINQQDTAAILYSSGTSGVSKGVVLSHENLIAVVELFVRFEALHYNTMFPILESVYLAAIPMFHIYGLSLFAIGLLSLGTKIVVMRKFDADEMVTAISRFGVTHFPAVPPILIALTRAKKLHGHNLGSLKQVTSGAAPLSKYIIQDFLQSFPHVDFIQGYGLTESTAVGTRGLNTRELRKYTSIGLLAPNTQAKVVDWNSGSCLPPGNSGELWLRGPGIMKGYLNNEAATRSAVDKDGWLHTGDIVYFDQDGYLYLVDRLKEIIKYKGFQIAPADIEDTLISHPEILDAAVTGIADDEAGEIPVAFVVKKPGSSLSQKDVINYVADQVAPHKKVRMVVFTHSIPKSPAGKILRRQLKSWLISRI